MARYIQGKDGKMAGSIGDGKTNTPAIYQLPLEEERTLLNNPEPNQVHDAYERFRQTMAPVDTDPITSHTEDDTTYLFPTTTDEVFADIGPSYRDPSKWTATLNTKLEDGLEMDDLQERDFDTREEAETWARTELEPRAREIATFDKAWNEAPYIITGTWKTRVPYNDLEIQSGLTDTGQPYSATYGNTRHATVIPYFEGGYITTVNETFDREQPIHRRTFNNFEQAHAFAVEMTLISDNIDYETMERIDWTAQ